MSTRHFMDILYFVLEIIIYFSMILLLNKYFKKEGIYVWIAIASILANIQVCKNVSFLGLNFTLGNVLFASTFLATDILSEYYSYDDAKKGVKIGTISIIIYIIISQITILFEPSEVDIINDSFKNIFTIDLRVTVSSLVMYVFANYLDVYLYNKFKFMKKWQKNNLCTIISNCLENFGFVFLSFLGLYDISLIIEIALTTSLIEIIIALLDTPFLYLAKK